MTPSCCSAPARLSRRPKARGAEAKFDFKRLLRGRGEQGEGLYLPKLAPVAAVVLPPEPATVLPLPRLRAGMAGVAPFHITHARADTAVDTYV